MRKLPLLLLLLPAIAVAGARGSNFEAKAKQGKTYYAPNSAIDGNLETAWLLPGETANRGEWIEVDVPQGSVDKVAIFPGFGKSDEAFKDYPRVKQLRVDIYALDDDQNATQVGSTTIDVADKAELQVFDLPDAEVRKGLFGGRVRLSVVDIHEGEDYPNLGVSELYVVLKEFDAVLKPATVAVTEGGDAGALALALDNDPKTFAKVGAGTVFTVESTNFGLSSLGFAPVKDFSRPKTVEVTFNGKKVTTVLPDKATEVQFAQVPPFNGYTGGAFGTVEIKIVDTYPGKNAEVGISELKAKATNFEG